MKTKKSQTRTSSTGRSPAEISQAKLRSAITNGTDLLRGVDLRGAVARRYRDCLNAHISDLGGPDELSEGQRALVRRATAIAIQLEILESKWAAEPDGEASRQSLQDYQTAANTLRRLIESLGTNVGRRPRDVSPPAKRDVTAEVIESLSGFMR